MGFPVYNYKDRSDNKLYLLHTPQSPLVRPRMYDYYGMDSYPVGTNSVVAVISYSGYDMEDAMVSHQKKELYCPAKERGMGNCEEGWYTVEKSPFLLLLVSSIRADTGAQLLSTCINSQGSESRAELPCARLWASSAD